MSCIVSVTTVCVFLVLAISLNAADEPSSAQQGLRDTPYGNLQEQRDQAEQDIRDKTNSRDLIKNQLDWRALEGGRQSVYDAARKNLKTPKDELDKLDASVKEAHDAAGYPKTTDQLKKDYDSANSELEAAKKRKSDIDKELSRRVEVEVPKQNFRSNMSIAFAALVGLVIIGFYLLAWIDETLRREMFSKQSGIQFITLFSLVIAIILFGITGILESRELSALLGGLSGYILGRNSQSPSGSEKAGTEPKPAP